MDEKKIENFAKQLRKPHGELGFQVGESMNKGNFHLYQNTLEVLAPKPNENILEIGMGNGHFVKDIVSIDPSIKYVGCDYSEEMIQSSTKNNPDSIESGQTKFYFAEASQLPLPNNEFDKIFTINTIYFWEDYIKVFNELRRVLKKDGELIISLRPRSLMQHYPFVKYGFKMFSKKELIKLLSDNNFETTEVSEKEEPDQTVEDLVFKVKSLIVVSRSI